MAKAKYTGDTKWEKEFIDLLNPLTYSRQTWQVWEDLVTVMACSICNAVDQRKEQLERREVQYKLAIERLGDIQAPANILKTVVMALEENPDQDFLGNLYMGLRLGDHWKGQFFTPYNICKAMAAMSLGSDAGVSEEIKKKGYISVADFCIGSGAMLIAAANRLKEMNINYQNHAVFVGQDIDRIVALMAYIQLSLLGCPGYIIVGDSLRNPVPGHVLLPQEDEYHDIWYMPMFTTGVWHIRRSKEMAKLLITKTDSTEKDEK